ncbi:RHS repeat domain-containing protein [Capnocytophaga canimorsus]|uniref:RHS repeat domain-containing protein n=1 Tax=Capnocytophaga canimorsus TaxID=28188 RepID=UPI0037CD0153
METKTDLEQDNLKGRVKRVIGYEIENYDPKSNSPQKIRYECIYNPQGRAIEKIFYEEDGNILNKQTCKYDEQGNKIEEISDNNIFSMKSIRKYNEKEELIEYIEYGYEDETVSRKEKLIYYEEGERGNRVKTIWYEYKFGKTFNVERYYNEHEKLIEAIYYKEGNIYRKETWKYDDKGNEIENICYDKNGKIGLKTTLKYDDKGNEIEYIMYYENGKIDFKITSKYDDKGNKIERIGHNSKRGFLGKNTWEYDNQGNLTEEIDYNRNGKIDFKETREYNNQGNLIEKIRYRRDGKIDFKKTWKYDDKGNEMERYEGRQDRKKWQEAFSKFTYENNRTTKERVRYTNGNISSEETWKYDEKGKLIEVSKRKKQNTGKWKEELTKYEYDDQDNWIQEMIFKQHRNKQIISKRVQEIEYYQDEE